MLFAMLQSSLRATAVSSVRNETISWKFTTLDVNRNARLERSEWRIFRREWKVGPGAAALGVARRRQIRRCWRNAVKFCDEDEDKVVSKREWSECIGLNLLQGERRPGTNRLIIFCFTFKFPSNDINNRQINSNNNIILIT